MNLRSGSGCPWVARSAFGGTGPWLRSASSAGGRVRVFAFATVVTAVAWSARGHAQPQPTSPASEPSDAGAGIPSEPPEPPSQRLTDALFLEPGASCLDRDRLVRRVARWLQSDRVDATLKVEVRGDPADPRKVAFVIDRAGERSLRAIDDGPSDCDQLHAALALSIALAIDANLGLGTEPAPDLPSDEALVRRKPEPQYLKLGAALMLHATSGLLTDISAGASARAELGFFPWLDFRLGAFGSTLDGQSIAEVPMGTFSLGLIAGRADACAAHALGKLRLLACAGGMGGVFTARGKDFSAASSTDSGPWGAAVGGFELQAALAQWLSLAAAVDLVVPFATRRIQVRDALGDPARPRTLTSVAVLVGAGPVLRFF